MIIYLPMADQELEVWAKSLNQSRFASGKYAGELFQVVVHEKGVETYVSRDAGGKGWTPVQTTSLLGGVGQKLFILAHGRESTANTVAVERPGCLSPKTVTMTAEKLAKQLKTDGLPTAVKKLKLLVCWGAKDREVSKRFGGTKTEAAFAGQFCSAVTAQGYCVRVTGYEGKIEMTGQSPKVVMSTGGADTPVTGDQVSALLSGGDVDGLVFANRHATHWTSPGYVAP